MSGCWVLWYAARCLAKRCWMLIVAGCLILWEILCCKGCLVRDFGL